MINTLKEQNMKTKFCLIFVLAVKLSIAQSHFEFTYDLAGNRVERRFVPLRISQVTDSLPESADDVVTNGVQVYPNPSSHTANVSVSRIKEGEKITLVLSDLEGKILFRKESALSNEQLDLSSFKNGIYFLGVYIANQKKTYKITKID